MTIRFGMEFDPTVARHIDAGTISATEARELGKLDAMNQCLILDVALQASRLNREIERRIKARVAAQEAEERAAVEAAAVEVAERLLRASSDEDILEKRLAQLRMDIVKHMNKYSPKLPPVLWDVVKGHFRVKFPSCGSCRYVYEDNSDGV